MKRPLIFAAVAVATLAFTGHTASATSTTATGQPERPCGLESEWTGTITATSNKPGPWRAQHKVDTGAWSTWTEGLAPDDSYAAAVGPFSPSKRLAVIKVRSDHEGGPFGVVSFVTLTRPAAYECPPVTTVPPTTVPPVTEPPTTAPPTTEPPVTAPPSTTTPATNPPNTEPPATVAPTTTAPSSPPTTVVPPSDSTTTSESPTTTTPPSTSPTPTVGTTPCTPNPSADGDPDDPTCSRLPETGAGTNIAIIAALLVGGGGALAWAGRRSRS